MTEHGDRGTGDANVLLDRPQVGTGIADAADRLVHRCRARGCKTVDDGRVGAVDLAHHDMAVHRTHAPIFSRGYTRCTLSSKTSCRCASVSAARSTYLR